ncbi:hypothetical protein EVAR_33481_1 [Eumeta japonica]|uniref:HAT C-terminal dimerisation domain-containing protein n=1 Tax=Eumeta variegata TaxID=151549 RepID=A0A4C1WHX2_EUMVA|nr:hypothetical protein EVAR_33481_1 [Eumeta japonica]
MVAPAPSTSSEMTASGGLWSVCENIIRESEEDDPLSTLSSNNSLKEEVEKYLRSPNIPRDADPLLFWHNDVLYPHLKKLAQKYFSFQMSSVASERLFSTAGSDAISVASRSPFSRKMGRLSSVFTPPPPRRRCWMPCEKLPASFSCRSAVNGRRSSDDENTLAESVPGRTFIIGFGVSNINLRRRDECRQSARGDWKLSRSAAERDYRHGVWDHSQILTFEERLAPSLRPYR